MADNNKQTPNRIPVRFVDGEERDETERTPDAGGADSELTPDEIGRASAYDDATEVRRRIDRGAEQDTANGRAQADDADAAGGPDPSELPRNRNEQDTTVAHADDELKAARNNSDEDIAGALRAAAPAAGPAVAELVATRAELRRVEGELVKLSEERQDLVDIIARRQADFENYRKRVERERAETYHRVVGDVVKRLFPVMDNLQRALAAESSVEATESEEFRHFLNGVELIRKQLNDAVEGLGVESVPTVGQPFDPHVHEAVATQETSEFDPDTVTQEMQRGYRLGDKLLRPAMVKVSIRQ